jgi:hypothetical protein
MGHPHQWWGEKSTNQWWATRPGEKKQKGGPPGSPPLAHKARQGWGTLDCGQERKTKGWAAPPIESMQVLRSNLDMEQNRSSPSVLEDRLISEPQPISSPAPMKSSLHHGTALVVVSHPDAASFNHAIARDSAVALETLGFTTHLVCFEPRRNDEVALRRKGRTHLRPGAILSLSQRTATVPLLLRRGESEA